MIFRVIFGPIIPKVPIFSHKFHLFFIGASHNDGKQPKSAGACPNQTYKPVTTHSGGDAQVSGELLSNFVASAPKLVIFSPNFTHFVL